MAQIEVRLKRSTIAQSPAVRRTAKALKLSKINSSARFEQTPAIAGMLRVVAHLVEVREV